MGSNCRVLKEWNKIFQMSLSRRRKQTGRDENFKDSITAWILGAVSQREQMRERGREEERKKD